MYIQMLIYIYAYMHMYMYIHRYVYSNPPIRRPFPCTYAGVSHGHTALRGAPFVRSADRACFRIGRPWPQGGVQL